MIHGWSQTRNDRSDRPWNKVERSDQDQWSSIGKYFGASFANGGTWCQLEKFDGAVVTQQVGGGDRGNVYGFSYASDTNNDFLTIKNIKKLISNLNTDI